MKNVWRMCSYAQVDVFMKDVLRNGASASQSLGDCRCMWLETRRWSRVWCHNRVLMGECVTPRYPMHSHGLGIVLLNSV